MSFYSVHAQMKLSIATMSQSKQFSKAIRRQNALILELKKRFEDIAVDECKHDVLLLVLVEGKPGLFRVCPGGDDVFEVEFGIESEEILQPCNNVLLIQQLGDALKKMIRACDGLGDARATFYRIIEKWTTEAIVAEDPDTQM